jgi:predicted DNA-binding protein (MmcQ/YjbR family)
MKVRINSIEPYFVDGEEHYRIILSGSLTKEEMKKMLEQSYENCIHLEYKEIVEEE